MRNRVFGVSASALLALALFFPVTVPAAGPAEVAPEQVTKDFIEALTIVEAQYAGDVDYPRVSKAAISSMLRVLDSYMASLQKLRDDINNGDDQSVDEFIEDAVKARDRWLHERTRADWQKPMTETDSTTLGERMNQMLFGRLRDRSRKRK